jgi:hypothetical protein
MIFRVDALGQLYPLKVPKSVLYMIEYHSLGFVHNLFTSPDICPSLSSVLCPAVCLSVVPSYPGIVLQTWTADLLSCAGTVPVKEAGISQGGISQGGPQLRKLGLAHLPPKVPMGSGLPPGAIAASYTKGIRQGEYMVRLDALCIHTSLVPRQSARQLAHDAQAGVHTKVQFVMTEQVQPCKCLRNV